MTTPVLGLKELIQNQSQPHTVVNAAVRALEVMTQLRVLDKNLATPPTTPAANARYIVGPSATGAWAGKEGKITYLTDGATWAFLTPESGWLAYVVDEAVTYQYTGGSPEWEQASLGGGGSSPADLPAHGNFTTVTAGSPLSAITLNLANGPFFQHTLIANIATVSITGVTTGDVNFFTLRLVQDGTGGWTFTPPASWKFPQGVSPYVYKASAGAGNIDLIQGVSYDDGTTWLCTFARDFG